MESIWCPYSGEYLQSTDMNIEHVIPESLGGVDAFTINVSRQENHRLGSQLDQKFANNPLNAMSRAHYDLHGHRKSSHKRVWKAEYNGLEGKIDFTKDEIEFRTYKNLNDIGANLTIKPKEVSIKWEFDLNIAASFGCKVALGAATFLYEDIFRKFGYHEQLRSIMNAFKSEELAEKLMTRDFISENKADFWILNWPKSLDPNFGEPWWRPICKKPNTHIIWTIHNISGIIMCISLFSGQFMWFINISNNTLSFPIGNEFELGAVIEIDIIKNTLRRTDLRTYLSEFFLKLNNYPK